MTTIEWLKAKSRFAAASAIIASAAFVLTACPSGTSDSGSTEVKGFAKGVITAKGSIFVNGVEYETGSGAITVDGASGSDADLEVGMYVELKGSIDPATGRGVADEVDYSSSIEGTVDSGSIDAVAGTFAVFGLLVRTDAFTVFKGTTGFGGTAPFAAGDRVEVSGVPDASTNSIAASRVKLDNASAEDYKLKGTVGGLTAATNGSFDLQLEDGGSLSVGFTGTLEADVVNGAYVKVEFSSAPSGGSLSTSADKIEAKRRLSADDGDRVEASGIVSSFNGSTDPVTFSVDGIAVSASALLAAGVADGVKVEVKGTMDGGTLAASELELERDAETEIAGLVTAVAAGAGTLSVNGVLIAAAPETIFEDDSDVPAAFFGLDDLAVGDYAEVKAFADSHGSLVAAKIERKEAESEAKLKGLVESESGTTIVVWGVSVDTAVLDRDPSDQAAFLAAVEPGVTVVELTGTVSGSSVTWTDIEIDD